LIGALLALAIGVAPTFETIAARPIDAVHKRYQAVDDKGVGLDCLKVVQTGKSSYLGVHHALVDGVFVLRLMESDDLLSWKLVRGVDSHAHQGTIFGSDGKWILAWEKDGPNGNWIRIQGFESLSDLTAGRPKQTLDIPRAHSTFAEGTPSIVAANLPDNWEESEIAIRFHFWRDGDVDRQAEGVLTAFKTWKSELRSKVNSELESKYRGNIGDRDHVSIGNTRYELLEAQRTKNDWASWRVLLGTQSKDYRELAVRTDKASTSFANPSATKLLLPNGKEGVFISYFLPSQGNHPSESGQLIFYRELSSNSRTSSN
jgi:hypothetical protein